MDNEEVKPEEKEIVRHNFKIRTGVSNEGVVVVAATDVAEMLRRIDAQGRGWYTNLSEMADQLDRLGQPEAG